MESCSSSFNDKDSTTSMKEGYESEPPVYSQSKNIMIQKNILFNKENLNFIENDIKCKSYVKK